MGSGTYINERQSDLVTFWAYHRLAETKVWRQYLQAVHELFKCYYGNNHASDGGGMILRQVVFVDVQDSAVGGIIHRTHIHYW
jgi:hypothetical protein